MNYLIIFLSLQKFSKRYLMDLMDKLKKDICIDIKDFILERYHNHLYCEKKKEKVYYIINQMQFPITGKTNIKFLKDFQQLIFYLTIFE